MHIIFSVYSGVVYTLAGSFTGALLYGAMEPALSGVLFHKHAQSANGVWWVIISMIVLLSCNGPAS